MQSTMYALVDCNNFFVSCERVFDPKLHNRPVIVLSSNDGCAISRSNEAKKLGVPMGVPLFQIQSLVRKHNIAILSSNFALYGDMSARVMQIISSYMPEVEIYSIDEAFLNLSNMQHSYNLLETCQKLAVKIEQDTGIPVSIGVAPTRTLAKVANHIAKKQAFTGRVVVLDSPVKISEVLNTFKVRDIWGIGRQLEKKLNAMGIDTAGQLLKLSATTIKRSFNIVMWRKVQELNGTCCIKLPDTSVGKQQIMVSRSFGERVTELAGLQQALATYASAACEKLRKQESVCGGLYVFLQTSLHGEASAVYKNSDYVHLPNPSNDTRVILQAAKLVLKNLFKIGYRYQKLGIILCDLSAAASMQIDLFGDVNLAHSESLMGLIDSINQKLGRHTLQFAASGLDKTWRVKSTYKSRNYTNNWQELPAVRIS